MTKIRNFGTVEFHQFTNTIRYSHFIKNNDGTWTKKNEQKYLENDVYLPNIEGVARIRQGKSQKLNMDIYGNPILSCVNVKFYDKNQPSSVRNALVKYGSDIHPTVKFLASEFEFDEVIDEIPPLRIQFMDIETQMDDEGFLQAWNVGPDCQGNYRGGVTLISTYDNIDDQTTIFGLHPYTGLDPLPERTTYKWCKDEKGILREYMLYLKATDPDIMTFWNGYDYDIPYILNRMILLFGPKSLNHFGNGSAWIDNKKRKLVIHGINMVDYMVLYKKFELKPRRSYALAHITEVENIKINGEGKIKYEGSLKDFYENDWNGFVRYCIQDSKLVYELDNKKKLIETFVMCCYMAGISFSQAIAQDVSWLRIHDSAIYRFCKAQGKELPENLVGEDNPDKFAGAFVMAPKPGVYDYVTVFDVNSLYPSCIRALNISIETYRGQVKCGDVISQKGGYNVEFYDSLFLSIGLFEKDILDLYNKYNKDQVPTNLGEPKKIFFACWDDFKMYLTNHNYCVAANGAIFTKDFRGVIPSILDHLIEDRKKSKKLYFEFKEKYQIENEPTLKKKYKAMSDRYNTIQMVKKVFANSLYGYLGTKYSRFYHTDLSEAVTSTGQYVLKSTVNTLNKNFENIVGVTYD